MDEVIEDLLEQWKSRARVADKLADAAKQDGDGEAEKRCRTKAGMVRGFINDLKNTMRDVEAPVGDNPHRISDETLCEGADGLRADSLPRLMVVTAAIKLNDGAIITAPRPCRHHHLTASWFFHTRAKLPQEEQGFMLSDGSFADRERAGEVAMEAGQIISHRHDKSFLYSEDIW